MQPAFVNEDDDACWCDPFHIWICYPFTHSYGVQYCHNSILTYYHHPQFKDSVSTEYESVSQIIDILLNSAGAEHPLLNPYTLHYTTNFIHVLMLELRKDEAVLDCSCYVRSKCSTTLVLFSPKEWHTPFHFVWTALSLWLDWSEELGSIYWRQIQPS
jgi:hypothetical protein